MLSSKNFDDTRDTQEMKKKCCAKQVGLFQDFTLHALLTFALPYSKCEVNYRLVDELD